MRLQVCRSIILPSLTAIKANVFEVFMGSRSLNGGEWHHIFGHTYGPCPLQSPSRITPDDKNAFTSSSYLFLYASCVFHSRLSGLEVICLCFPFPPPLFLFFPSLPLLLVASIELLYWDWNTEDVDWLYPQQMGTFCL